VAQSCTVLEESLHIVLQIDEVLWGEAANEVVMAFGPSVYSRWNPEPTVTDQGINWGGSSDADPIVVGQRIGARIQSVEGGRFVPSLLFAIDADEIVFQQVRSECGGEAPATTTAAALTSTLADCEVLDVDTASPLGDAICHDEPNP
jgi:hypothetical protein